MDFNNKSEPIYKQIADIIKYDIAAKKIDESEKLPSIRDLALKFKVNPNTVVRALSELENERLIFTDRTNGKFVTSDKEIINSLKSNISNLDTIEYIVKLKDLNISKDEALSLLQSLWEENYEW